MDATVSGTSERRIPRQCVARQQQPHASSTESSVSPKRPRKSKRKRPKVELVTSPNDADGEATDEGETVPRYKRDRWKRLDVLRDETKEISRILLASACKVLGPKDARLVGKCGLLLECQSPRSWLFDKETGYDTDEDDEKFSTTSSASTPADDADEIKLSYLFLDFSVLKAAECGAVNRTCFDTGMEPSISKTLDSIFAHASSISTGNSHADENDDIGCRESSSATFVRDCDLSDYKFEQVAWLLYDLLRCAKIFENVSCVHGKQHLHARSSLVTPPPSSSQQPQSRRGSKKASKNSAPAAAAENSDENTQQSKVVRYLDYFDFGQNWWEPINYTDFEDDLRALRIYPRIAQGVYDLSRSFGRLQLQRDCEAPMLWEWGVEVKLKAWSLPDYSWFVSKFSVAGHYGTPALFNFLLIMLEKKFLALNEALSLYEVVAHKITPIAAMYVERELTMLQCKSACELEWILTTIRKEKPDSVVYDVELVDSILLRAACTKRGELLLKNACRSDYAGELKAYKERFRRILLLAQLKARFTVELSPAGVPNENLRKVFVDAAHKASSTINNSSNRFTNDDAASSSSRPPSSASASTAYFSAASSICATAGVSSAEKVKNDAANAAESSISVTFTFHLFRSNIEFAVELAEALQILQPPSDPDGKVPLKSKARKTMLNSLPATSCATIDWQKIEIKQVSCDEGGDASGLYERAQAFHALPFVYMPSENVLFVRAFRRYMPLDHPMICMLLHTLYDNRHANIFDADVLDKVSSSSSDAVILPKLHFHLRILSDTVEHLFVRHFDWQRNHMPVDAVQEDEQVNVNE